MKFLICPFIYPQTSTHHAPTPLSEGALLTLEHVGRQHAGVYLCKAENGVREAVHAEVNLKVLCKPLVRIIIVFQGTSEHYYLLLIDLLIARKILSSENF